MQLHGTVDIIMIIHRHIGMLWIATRRRIGYINFLPYNRRNDKEWISQNTEWLKSAMKRKKDFYRRNRDLCIISMIGVYVVAMIDAYVDAQLYHFDITPDVSMHLLPAVMEPTPFSRTSLGLQCAITF